MANKLLELDDALLEAGVKFLPYIGKNYGNGIIGYDSEGIIKVGNDEEQGKTLLTLGLCHYFGSEGDATTTVTRDVISRFCDPNSEYEGWMNTFTKYLRALSGNCIERKEAGALLDYTAFYNFIQEFLSDIRMKLSQQQLKVFLNKAYPIFLSVLKELKPDIIVGWGNVLNNFLQDKGVEGTPIVLHDGKKFQTRILQVDGKDILYVPFRHPASSFSWIYYHELFLKLFSI